MNSLMLDREEIWFDVDTMERVSECCEKPIEPKFGGLVCSNCRNIQSFAWIEPDADQNYIDYWLRYEDAENERETDMNR